MRSVFAAALVAGVIVTAQCRNEPANSTAGSAGIDRSRLCKDGGADLDEKSNACVCPDAARWDGFKCVAAGEDKPSAASMTDAKNANAPATEGEEDAKAAAAAALLAQGATPLPAAAGVSKTSPGGGLKPSKSTDSPTDQVAADATSQAADTAQPGDGAASLAQACRQAHATWLASSAYCHCPDGKVLVGSRCRMLPGVVTDDACERAVYKGKWLKGRCLCSPGQVFSPSRGGCVAPLTDDSQAMGRRVCESSMNRGRWDARSVRCECPEGRIWMNELCEVRGNLTSHEVCESGYNGGRWDGVRRRCDCPARRSPDGSGGMQMWIDQGCRPSATVSEPTACVAESNGGRWNASLKTCVCPGGDRWDSAARLCVGTP